MVCQFCKQKEATVHLTQIVENQVKKVDLCDSCAKQKGVNDPTGFALADLLLGLGASQEMEQVADADGGEAKCPQCGYTHADFKKSGRLGCAACYEVFSEGLEALLKGMHKGVEHHGKVPPRMREALDLRARLHRMQTELDAAVAREDFESAARLRDDLKALRATGDARAAEVSK